MPEVEADHDGNKNLTVIKFMELVSLKVFFIRKYNGVPQKYTLFARTDKK